MISVSCCTWRSRSFGFPSGHTPRCYIYWRGTSPLSIFISCCTVSHSSQNRTPSWCYTIDQLLLDTTSSTCASTLPVATCEYSQSSLARCLTFVWHRVDHVGRGTCRRWLAHFTLSPKHNPNLTCVRSCLGDPNVGCMVSRHQNRDDSFIASNY